MVKVRSITFDDRSNSVVVDCNGVCYPVVVSFPKYPMDFYLDSGMLGALNDILSFGEYLAIFSQSKGIIEVSNLPSDIVCSINYYIKSKHKGLHSLILQDFYGQYIIAEVPVHTGYGYNMLTDYLFCKSTPRIFHTLIDTGSSLINGTGSDEDIENFVFALILKWLIDSGYSFKSISIDWVNNIVKGISVYID